MTVEPSTTWTGEPLDAPDPSHPDPEAPWFDELASSFEFAVEQLPESKAGWSTVKSNRLREYAEFLRAHPGEWARYPFPLAPTSAAATGSRIRRGNAQIFLPIGAWETAVRKAVLYVRYVGTP